MRTQAATIRRDRVNAVKIVVKMPMMRVRAKPRTGPEPRKKSTTAAISVVMLELDANITTLIAAVVLFFLGSGPVRGFALSAHRRHLHHDFTAFTLSRLIVAVWVRMTRPAAVRV